jgi:hypothetical protein
MSFEIHSKSAEWKQSFFKYLYYDMIVLWCMQSSLGSNTERLVRVSTAEGAEILEEVASDDRCDAGDVVMDEVSRKVQAVAFVHLYKKWTVVDPEVGLFNPLGVNHVSFVLKNELQIYLSTLTKQVPKASNQAFVHERELVNHFGLLCTKYHNRQGISSPLQ